MSVEKITARILQEAQDEAAALKAKAEAERDAMLQKAKDEAAMQTLTMQQKAQTDALLLKERRKSVAELEARKLRLSAKQEKPLSTKRRNSWFTWIRKNTRSFCSHFWLPTTSR